MVEDRHSFAAQPRYKIIRTAHDLTARDILNGPDIAHGSSVVMEMEPLTTCAILSIHMKVGVPPNLDLSHS